MAYDIFTNDQDSLVTVRTQGDLEAEEFYEMIKKTEVVCREKGIRNALVDHSASTVRNISSEEVHSVALLCAILNDAMSGGKLAVVLIHDVDFGLGRMWESYTTNKLSYTSRLFRNLTEAEEWLNNE